MTGLGHLGQIAGRPNPTPTLPFPQPHSHPPLGPVSSSLATCSYPNLPLGGADDLQPVMAFICVTGPPSCRHGLPDPVRALGWVCAQT